MQTAEQNALLDVEVGVIFNEQQEVLIAQRLPGSPHPGCWEFPGGKREIGEDSYQSLTRELREEVGIAVTQARPFMTHAHAEGVAPVRLSVWLVTDFVGEPRGCEGQAVFWHALKALDATKFPPGNKIIIDALLATPFADLLSHPVGVA